MNVAGTRCVALKLVPNTQPPQLLQRGSDLPYDSSSLNRSHLAPIGYPCWADTCLFPFYNWMIREMISVVVSNILTGPLYSTSRINVSCLHKSNVKHHGCLRGRDSHK